MNFSNRLRYYVALVRFYVTPWDGIHTKPNPEAFISKPNSDKMEAPLGGILLPTPKLPDPSCLIEGIAKAWVEKKGWKVSRRKGSILTLDGAAELWNAFLHNPRLGVTIKCQELISGQGVSDIHVEIEGKREGLSNKEVEYLTQTIESHPYSALKRRMTEKNRQESSRATKIKTLEKLGCPANPPL